MEADAADRAVSARADQALWMYRFSRGSTLIRSPTFTKSGTWTTPPVSSVAGFVTFEPVSPFTPGSVSVTSRTTDAGRSTPVGSPPTNITWTLDDGCMNGSSSSTIAWGTDNCSYVAWSMKT